MRGSRMGSWILLAGMLALAMGVSPALGESVPETADYPWGESPRPERLSGLTLPSKDAILMSPVDALLESILVEEGQRVEAGAVVARMDDAMQVATVEASRLQMMHAGRQRQAQLAMDEAERELARYASLHGRGAATDWELDRSRLRLAQAEAMVEIERERRELAEAEYKIEQLRLERYQIAAPFAGRVIRHGAEIGELVGRNDPVIHLVSLDPLEAELHLPLSLYGHLKVGQKYRLTAQEPVNQTVIGELRLIEPLIDVGSRTFRCVFVIANPEHRWPAGFRVQLQWPPTPVPETAE